MPKKTKKTKVAQAPVIRMVVRPFDQMEEAVEIGVARGFYRAYKHSESGNPIPEADEDRVKIELTRHIMDEICERFDLCGESPPED